MIVTCPCCHARYAIEAGLNDDAARQAVAAASKLPGQLGDLVLRYIALFRPEKRALSWDRAARLLTEISDMIQAGRIERHGRLWAAPVEAWRDAITEMLNRRDKLTLPLDGHGYLLAIIEGRASKTEAREETRTEQTRRHAPDRKPNAPAGPVAIGAHLEKLKDAVK